MSAKHTPTPWSIVSETLVVGESGLRRDIVNVASTDCGNTDAENQYERRQQNKANAEFIVRAVNSHEKLLTQLQNALDLLRSYGGDRVTWDETNPIEDTIAQAKEVQP